MVKILKGKIFDKNWVFLVNRPFTLFGASLYLRWFDPPLIFGLFGKSIPDNLYIEEHPNVVRRYVIEEQLDSFTNLVRNIVVNERRKCKEILEKGLKLSEEAKRYIKKSPFSDIQSAVDFMVKLALHATIFPYFAYPVAKEINDKELIKWENVKIPSGIDFHTYQPVRTVQVDDEVSSRIVAVQN